MLNIGREYALTPTMAAIQFGINLDEWNGLPIQELLSSKEKEAIKGSSSAENTGVEMGRKRVNGDGGSSDNNPAKIATAPITILQRLLNFEGILHAFMRV
ncbi:hypothetical protein Aduo_015218 [Ancylostoma duodenale]